jgi:TP901 family phage tail tape measure protein
MAADFDQSMRNVNSIMGASEKQLGKFSDQVLKMSTEFPQSATTLANGLYDIASSGFAGADAMEILDASARAASAGMTEAEISSKAIVSVLNAYGLEAKDAAHVSDVLFRGVDKGVLSFEELASSLGDYVGAASQLKIPIEDVVAAQAAMTLTGISASEAATSLNQVMRSLLKPSEDMAKTLKAMGFESGQAALESLGLQGVITSLSGEVGNNVGAWLDLFPEIRAARGAMALAANDGEGLNRIMRDMEDVACATGRAFEEQSKGAMFQFTLALNQLKRAAIELGQDLIPIITKDIIPAIQGAIRWWRGRSDESKSLTVKLAALALVAGPLLRLASVFVRVGGAAFRLVGWLRGLGAASKAAEATQLPLFNAAAKTRTGFTGLAGKAVSLAGKLGLIGGAAAVVGVSLNRLAEHAETTIDKFQTAAERSPEFAAELEKVGEMGAFVGKGIAPVNTLLGDMADEVLAVTEPIERLTTILDSWGVELSQGTQKLVNAYIAAGDYGSAQKLLAREVRNAARENQNLSKDLDQVGGALRGAETKARLYNRELDRIPKNKHTRITADTSQAREALNSLLGLLGRVSGGAAIAVRAGINRIQDFHEGGYVERSGLAVVHRGEVFSGVNQDFGPFGEAGRVVNEIHNARHAFLRSGSQAIRRTGTPQEAQDWRQLMRAELRAPGVSALQRQLLQSAVQAVRDETTREEARGFRRSVRTVDGRERIDIHLDRRRFAGAAAYDHTYRGW